MYFSCLVRLGREGLYSLEFKECVGTSSKHTKLFLGWSLEYIWSLNHQRTEINWGRKFKKSNGQIDWDGQMINGMIDNKLIEDYSVPSTFYLEPQWQDSVLSKVPTPCFTHGQCSFVTYSLKKLLFSPLSPNPSSPLATFPNDQFYSLTLSSITLWNWQNRIKQWQTHLPQMKTWE